MKPGSDTAKARVVILTNLYRIKCSINIVPGVRLTVVVNLFWPWN